MKKLLSYYRYQNAFYEIFADESGAIIYQKFGYNDGSRDKEIVNKIIDEIKKRKYIKSSIIDYKGLSLNLYVNLFDDRIYFSKVESDGTESVCPYEEYKELYDTYNNVVAHYPSGKQQPRDDKGKTSKKMSATKKLKVMVAGVLVVVTVLSSGVLYAKLATQNSEIIESNISYREPPDSHVPTGQIHLYDETQEQSHQIGIDENVQNIRESLQGEEHWVIDKVVNDYLRMMGQEVEVEDMVTENTEENTKVTNQLIQAIQSNSSLSEEDKQLFVGKMVPYWNSISDKVEDVESLALTLKTISISDGQGEMPGELGEYIRDENQIVVKTSIGKDSVKCHEMVHAHGYFPGLSSLSEGYAEANNPLRAPMIYQKEQIMLLMLEEVFGEDAIHQAFQNESLIDIYNHINENLDEEEAYQVWSTLFDIDEYLNKYSQRNIDSLLSSESYREDTNAIMQKVAEQYELITRNNFDENEVLMLCYDMLTGEHKSKKHDGYNLVDVCRKDGKCQYLIGKDGVEYSYVDIDSQKVRTSSTSAYGRFNVGDER